MAYTTRNIASLGTHPTDPTFVMNAQLYIPDPTVWSPPYHCFIGTHSPHFTGSADLSNLNQPFRDMVEKGFLCLAFAVRSLEPFNGQTTFGFATEQTDDCKIGVRYMRPGAGIETIQGFTVTGFVAATGASGAAHHALWMALDGTPGDDQADAAITCSAPTNYANRESDVRSEIILKMANYANLPDTDLVGLRALSPIALDLANAKPVQLWNGEAENIPISMVTGPDGMNVNMAAAGAVGYEPHINTGELRNKHGFAMWTGIRLAAMDWVVARAAEFLGQEPPPPPEETGRVKVTALITNLAPGLALTLNVGAHDTTTNLDGPITTFDFISDRADTGGGTITTPTGIYALVDAVEGVITGTIGTRAWLGYAYVDGGTLPTTWKALNPTGRDSYDWSQTDAFMAALFANNKQGGIAVNMGIKNPLWIYGGGHAVSAVTVSQPNSGTIPIPWDANYLGVCKGFIKAFALKYDAHPNLSYIVVGGMGQLLETLLVQAAADYNNLNNLAVVAGFPNLLAGWVQTSNGLLDLWSKAFPTTPVYLAIETPVPVANGGLVGIDEFARAAIDRYRTRLGLMTLQLDGLTGADANLSLNSIIRDADRTARAYRFRYPSTDPNCDPSQAPELYDPELGLQNAGAAGVAIGVQMEELYEADVLTLTGSYPASLAALQTDLTNNAI